MFMPQPSEMVMIEFPRLDIDLTLFKPWLTDREKRIARMELGFASRGVMADSERGGWYCLAVDHGHEKAVDKMLADADVETYLPTFPAYEYRRRGRVKTMPEKVIYDGYVMVRCGCDRRAFRGMAALKHVIGVLGGMTCPMRVSDESMSRFRQMVSDLLAGRELAPSERRKLMKGDMVEVVWGPFADLRGRIVQVTKKDVWMELGAMGRVGHPVRMPLAWVEKL